MNRKAARAAAKAALTTLGVFKLIKKGAVDTFGGATPVAIVTSGGMERVHLARDVWSDVNSINVSIYVERPAAGDETTEDTLDDLTLAVIGALDGLDDSLVFARSDAGSSGAPNRIIDGKVYRIERVSFSVVDEVAS